MREPLVVADMLDRYDLRKILVLRAKGETADEIADKLGHDRIEVIRLLRVIRDISRTPT